MWRPDARAAVRSGFSKQKTRNGFFRAGAVALVDDVTMPVICPTCQTFLAEPELLHRCAHRK
jgi:hypothetical protein